MTYDFTTRPDRSSCGAYKWLDMYRRKPDVSKDVVPLSVADMEFVNAPEIREGLKSYIDGNVLGYTGPTDAYYNAAINWFTRRHGFTPKREWFCQSAGVVPALYQLVPAFTKPEDSVLILSPVYYPFRSAIKNSKRKIIESRLVECGRRYVIDFKDFERKVKRPEVTLFILCSPHNPIGRVWTREELVKMLKLCRENGVTVIADEIHGDLILPGVNYVSVGTLPKNELKNCIICTAPSKTFNLAGMQTSNLLIPSAALRKRFVGASGYHSLTALGYKACELAYTYCEAWLDELMEVINDNRLYIENFLAENCPNIIPFELEGTYLMWLDFRALGLKPKALEEFLEQKAQLFFDSGYIFGAGGEGFERVNLACPTEVIKEAMQRLKMELESLAAE